MQIGCILSTPTQSFLRLARIPSLTRHLSAFNPTTNHSPHLQHNIDHVGGRAEDNRRRRPTPLQRLDLAGIWPGKKELAEEMSPRKLNRLQRLLSDAFDKQSSSPRCPLGPDRWRDYHGRQDWAGLLDPLDDNLRREIIRYGELVQSAYRTFHSNPACPPPVSALDRAYKVTRSLYATSALGLPEWVPPELGWAAQRSSWAGFVGVCDDAGEIRRMGRRDIVVVLRGTATCLEWAENARAHLVPIDGPGNSASAHPKVQCGFWSLYTTRGTGGPSLSELIVDEVRRLVAQYEGEELSITVTGHSLGAALAVLAADELSTCLCGARAPPVAVVSFGGPQVGNAGFASRIRSNGVKVLRVVNTRDVITKVPYLAYSHVGSELRLDSNVSPVLKPNAGLACCHDLEAYLHLVDGFTGPDCPFRDNAKRPIWRLLNEQRSNVKKLYTNEAQQLKWLAAP